MEVESPGAVNALQSIVIVPRCMLHMATFINADTCTCLQIGLNNAWRKDLELF